MRLVKWMTSIAAGVCILAAFSARSQVTNHVTFSAVSVNQGAVNDNGTNTTFAPPKVTAVGNALLLHEIGLAVVGTNGFTAAAKLVLITGHAPTFAVIDGANFYDLSGAGFNIMNVTNSLPVQVTSGKESDAGVQENRTQRIPVVIVYDDTASGTGNQLKFTLNGIVTVTETRTAPVNNIFTDTVTGKISGLTGGGTSNGKPFVATATITFSGSAKLPAT